MSEKPVCDFCASPDIHWSYPARNFIRKERVVAVAIDRSGIDALPINVTEGFAGGWAACNACHALIERSDRDRLARRSAKRLLRDNPEIRRSLASAIREVRRIQDAFWSNREGAPVQLAHGATTDPTRP